jgi:hypothetical protein
VFNNLFAKYARKVLLNTNKELIINIEFTFLIFIIINETIENKLTTNKIPNIIDKI